MMDTVSTRQAGRDNRRSMLNTAVGSTKTGHPPKMAMVDLSVGIELKVQSSTPSKTKKQINSPKKSLKSPKNYKHQSNF